METLIDYSKGVDITGYTTSTNQFKAPCNGIILLAGNASEYGYINNQRFATRQSGNNIYVNNQTILLNKGDSYYGNYESAGINALDNKFFPYVGNGSLYYYVGETVQNANLIDAGRIGEVLANKADISTPSIQAPYLKNTYVNGTSGYRIWSDGYCEQWGYVGTAGGGNYATTVTLLKTYRDTNYCIMRCLNSNFDNVVYGGHIGVRTGTQTTNSFGVYYTNVLPCWWKTCGYLAEGEY